MAQHTNLAHSNLLALLDDTLSPNRVIVKGNAGVAKPKDIGEDTRTSGWKPASAGASAWGSYAGHVFPLEDLDIETRWEFKRSSWDESDDFPCVPIDRLRRRT